MPPSPLWILVGLLIALCWFFIGYNWGKTVVYREWANWLHEHNREGAKLYKLRKER